MQSLEQAWYGKAGWLLLLWPRSVLFRLLASVRRAVQSSAAKKNPSPLPVIIVGNISIGGTGKTPFIIALGNALKKAGLKPGVISRGYLGKAPHYPFKVESDSPVEQTGDEPLLIARALNCPVVIDPDRRRALQAICAEQGCDVVLSDDGLQHYTLPRDLEIVIVDGERLFGNGLCLPAGPLREPVSRLGSASHIVVNGEPNDKPLPAELTGALHMALQPTFLVNMVSGEKKPFRGAPFNIGTTVHAVTGLGNPSRFFNLLSTLPYEVKRHDFPDHHPFTAGDIEALGIDERQPIVMTEKDAVKCEEFARPNFWYLAVQVKLPDEWLQGLLKETRQLIEKRKSAAN